MAALVLQALHMAKKEAGTRAMSGSVLAANDWDGFARTWSQLNT